MSDRVLKYEIKLDKNDIWYFSLYSANRAYLGIFNLLFTMASVYFLINSWYELSLSRKILFLVCSLMFSVIQPAILYLKATKQASTDTIKKGFVLELSKEEILVSQDGNTLNVAWEEVYKTMIRKSMIVIYFAPLRGYLIPNRYLGDTREELENLLKEKTRVTRF